MSKYCGIGKVPKDAERGSDEYCLEHNQVRYWGLKKIDPSIVKKVEIIKNKDKIKTEIRTGEIIIRALTKKGELILKDIDRYQSKKYLKKRLDIFETEKEKEKEKKRIQKRLEEIKDNGRHIAKKIKAQYNIINTLQKELQFLKENK